jgi:phage terminase large subunit-like protein
MRLTGSSKNSSAELFLSLPIDERKKRIAELSPEEAEAILYNWDFWSRPSQKIPPGDDWRFWLVRAGRGFGKTRVGAETVRVWIRTNPIIHLIGPTATSARDVMIEGESGVLAICPPSERPEYIKTSGQLRWPNGAKCLVFSADEPERLRGPQCFKLWADELASWRYAEAWDMAMFGLRLGMNPQAIVSSTPKPVRTVKELIKNAATFETRGTTYDNRTNLAPSFYAQIITKYEGTRLGRQELDAELLEDNPNAFWTHEGIDADRISPKDLPALERIVVPIDPAVSSNEDSDETGIVPVARDHRYPPHFYVLDDLSGIYTPNEWAVKAVASFKNLQADRIIGEVNNGGDLVEANLRNVDVNLPYTCVRATRGKDKRAEPISGLYQQHRVHHVGIFPILEDQMCDYNPADPNGPSPDRMDSLVWGLWELSEGHGQLAVVELTKEEVARREMEKIQTSELMKPATNSKTESCPHCGKVGALVRRGNVKHCTNCGREEGLPGVKVEYDRHSREEFFK